MTGAMGCRQGAMGRIPDPRFLIRPGRARRDMRRALTSDLRPLVAGVLCLLATLAGAIDARAQMPDMRQMSGIPRPVNDLPNGSVSVRVIRGDLSNPIVNHPVQMRAGNTTQTANTDAEGRAQFDNIAAGTPVKFSADVDGEHLESQEFAIQPQGGVRLLLVATDKSAAGQAASAAPAVPGSVVIGGESRIVIEPTEETVSVYYILDIVNGATAPVNPEKPFVFTLPASATGTTVIQGSSPLASNKGREVTVAGPFPTGTTAIQVAAEFPVGTGSVEIAQAFPAPIQQLVVIAKKAGNMKMASPQFSRTEETVIEGTAVILGMGGELPAGQTMALTLTGLPHHSSVPRTIALSLAGVIVLIGVWAATWTSGDAQDRTAERKRLLARREKLFQDLLRLEQDHRRGKIDGPRYAARREELVQALENVYGALDEDDTGPEPAAKRTGVAA